MSLRRLDIIWSKIDNDRQIFVYYVPSLMNIPTLTVKLLHVDKQMNLKQLNSL